MSKITKSQQKLDIGCLEAIDGLYAWLDGELEDASAIESIEYHVGHCRSCYSRAEIEKLLTERIRESMRSQAESEAPEALHQRLENLMKKL